MGWQRLEDVDEEGLTPMERARRLQRYARKVMKLSKQGRYDPEKTALARMMGLRSSRALEGLADEMDAFTPAQQVQLRRLAQSLRRYAQRLVVGHVHDQRRGRGRVVVTERDADRLTDLPIEGWDGDDDAELGFLPAIPAIIGAAAPLLGSLLGGGKKSSPSPAPAAAPAAGAASNVNLPAIGGVVADQIRAVPPPVRQQVMDGVREIMDRQKAGQLDVASMMKQIADLMGPKLKGQLEAVNQAALQRQATYEHNALKRSDERWKNNAEAQRRILARLDEMESKVGAAIESKSRRMDAAARAFGIPQRYR